MASTTYSISSHNQYISGYVSIEESNTNIANNTSDVTVTAYLHRTNTYSGSPTQLYGYPVTETIVIDGTTYTRTYTPTSSNKLVIPNDKSYVLIYSATKTVTHDADGSKTVSVSFSMSNTYTVTGFVVDSTSGSLTLDTIPRSPSYTSINASNINEDSVYLSATIDTQTLSITAGGWDLSTDGGSTWTYYNNEPTGKYITGLNPNTTYWYRGYCVTDGGSANSSWGSFSTYDYVKPTALADVTITNAITVNVYNPLGRTYTLDLISNVNGATIGSYTGTINGIVQGFNDNTSVTKQFNSLSNASNGTFYARVYCSATSSTKNSSNATYYVPNNAIPTITGYIKDTNSTTVALTNNDNQIISGYSTATIYPTIVASYQSLDTGATITSKAVNGTIFTTDTFYVLNTTTSNYTVSATNSHGSTFTASAILSASGGLHPYFSPTINKNSEFVRPTQTGTDMEVTFSGTVYHKYFDTANDKNLNNITINCYVRKKSTDTWTKLQSINAHDAGSSESLLVDTDYTLTDTTYNSVVNVALYNPFDEDGYDAGEWNYLSPYLFKIEIVDELTPFDTVILTQNLSIAEAYYEWWRNNDTNYFNVNGVFMKNNVSTGITELYGQILGKTVYTLKDTVTNYDMIIISTTANKYGHWEYANLILKAWDINSSHQWKIYYYNTDNVLTYAGYVLLYDNKIDTSNITVSMSSEQGGFRIDYIHGVKL